MHGQAALDARNLPDQLADQLVIMIATGELEPGQRIFEKKICEMKGVSRIPVREALRLLQAQGVVRTEPNRGTYVTEYTSDEMLEVQEMRLAVERIALRRIVERRTRRRTLQASSARPSTPCAERLNWVIDWRFARRIFGFTIASLPLRKVPCSSPPGGSCPAACWFSS